MGIIKLRGGDKMELVRTTKPRCSKCNEELTAEERLLSAIFGKVDSPLCYDCQHSETRPRCYICRLPTELTRNGIPYCPTHMEMVE